MKNPRTPELIASIDVINDGNDEQLGDRIVGISVRQDKELHSEGTVDIDIRGLDNKHENLVIRLSLPELVAAIATATLNADRE